MSVIVAWDDPEQTILRWDLLENWNWNEVRLAQEMAALMLSGVRHVVNFIVNIAPEAAPGSATLADIQCLTRNYRGKAGVIVFVGCQTVFQSIVRVFANFFPDEARRLAFSESDEQARRLLNAVPS
jgi:hypothetical protein